MLYRLHTMPPGIPTWFIARSHRFSKKVHWRTGALLGHGDGQHRALVRADSHRETVELAVRGPMPAAFFSVLDDGLNLTLERFPGPRITRQLPCRCGPGCAELFDYEDLRSRLAPHTAEGHDRVPQVRRGRVRARAAARARTVRTRHGPDEHGADGEHADPSVFSIVRTRKKLAGSAHELRPYCEESVRGTGFRNRRGAAPSRSRPSGSGSSVPTCTT